MLKHVRLAGLVWLMIAPLARGGDGSVWPGKAVHLSIRPSTSQGRVEIEWTGREDSLYTLLKRPSLGSSDLPTPRLIPGPTGGGTHVELMETAATPTAFFSLKARRMVPAVVDDFNRPSAELQSLGQPPLGKPWKTLGLGGVIEGLHGFVTGGDFVTDIAGYAGVTYLGQKLSATPCLLEADFRWEAAPGAGSEGVFTMACGPSDKPNWIHRLVHLRVVRTAAFLDIMDNGVFTNVARADFPQLPLQARHNCKFYLDAEVQSVLVILDGDEVLRYTHPVIGRLAGPYVFWEHYYAEEDSEARLFIERVFAAVP